MKKKNYFKSLGYLLEKFGDFLDKVYHRLNRKGHFVSTSNYCSYLKRGLANIKRSEYHLLCAEMQDIHNYIAKLGDLPAYTDKDKKNRQDEQSAMRAYLLFYKYQNGLLNK